MKDLMSEIKVVPAIAATTLTDNTATTAVEVDRLGYNSVTFAVLLGLLADADATFVATLTESDTSGSGYTSVDSGDIVYGSETTWNYSADGVAKKIGYSGTKRYVKLTVTPSGNSGNAPISAVAILGHAGSNPAGATQTP